MSRARRMEREDYESAADYVFSNIEQAFQRALEITPMLFGLQLDEGHKVGAWTSFDAAQFFQEQWGPHGRRMASMALLDLARQPEVDIAVLVVRSWIVIQEKAPTWEEVLADLEDHPDKQDAIVAILRTPEFSTVAQFLVHDGARLEKLELPWGPDGYTGPMSHRPFGEKVN